MSSSDEANAADLQGWVGRAREDEGRLDPAFAAMLGATLREDWTPNSRFAPGDAAPPLWHWAAFPPTTPMKRLAADGHAKKGDADALLPDVGLERRMWAGGAFRFLQPIRIGEALKRRSRIASIRRKTGSAGPMAFVAVEHEIEGERGRAIQEIHDVVYLNIPERYSPPAPVPAPEKPDHQAHASIDPVRLFRYSACTFNSHRIHYDLQYATEVERYPGLVVHGPLQATLLIEAATRWRGAPPSAFRYRGVRPMFHFDDLSLFGVETGDGGLDLCTADPGGAQGMRARADWT